jgi:hypothetical protein
VKKLFSSLFIAGLLLTGVVGCGGSPTSEAKKTGGTKEEKIKAAETKVAAAEKALKDAKADIKPEDKKKLEDDVAAAKKELEEAKKAQ